MLKGILRRRADATELAGEVPAQTLLDRAGRPRSPITLATYRRGTEPLNKGRRFPAEPLTGEEVYRLLAACERIGRSATIRNQALIVCFWRSGLRCAEALALMPKDVDLVNGRIAVLHGKGDKRRIVALDAAACEVLGRWARQRSRLKLGAGEPFFCVVNGPTRGMALGSPYVRDLLKRLAREAGVEKRVHPHGLRHTYASYVFESGLPINYIKTMLGHTDLAMTAHYCDHLNPFAAVERVRGVEWPAPPPLPIVG